MSKAMRLKARIKNMAAQNCVPAQSVLQNFMLEHLLERISSSVYKDKFILKGGMLIASLVGIGQRTTMDMDTTLKGYPLNKESLQTALSDICAIQLDDDTTFVLEHIDPIQEADEYGGYRVAVTAKYESIHTPLKIDITTGDAITPEAIRYQFHSNFEDRTIDVWAYNLETILAEKIETILRRSVLNTRLRDFYDVYVIVKTRAAEISAETFNTAVHATARKRASQEALQNRERIIASLRADTIMSQRWDRYSIENDYAKNIKFDEVLDVLSGFASAMD